MIHEGLQVIGIRSPARRYERPVRRCKLPPKITDLDGDRTRHKQFIAKTTEPVPDETVITLSSYGKDYAGLRHLDYSFAGG
jgi:hypothetical protein